MLAIATFASLDARPARAGPPGGSLAALSCAFPGVAGSPQDDLVEVIVSRLDARAEAVRASSALLSQAERDRAGRFVFERDRNRFILGRARLRKFLGQRLGVRPDAIELVYGAHGKPALAPRQAATGWRFNLSHCGDVAVHAFSRHRDIGVDVEAVRTLPDADDIVERFFSRREREAYRALDSRDKPLGFFNCWTRKEAFIKALGDGLSCPLDRFDVSLTPGEPARIMRVGTLAGGDCGWMLHSFMPGPGLVGALVVRQVAGQTPSAANEPLLVRSRLTH
jgi:4'-phosphopantetheinyl transferase